MGVIPPVVGPEKALVIHSSGDDHTLRYVNYTNNVRVHTVNAAQATGNPHSASTDT